MAELRQKSALPGGTGGKPAEQTGNGAVLREIQGQSNVRLRTHLDAEEAVLAALPDLLPGKPLATIAGDITGLWLSPAHWLLVSQGTGADEVLRRIDTGLGSLLYSATDQSSALTAFSLEGDNSARVLSGGCGLDFSTAVFAPGQCARTRFSQVALLIHRTAENAFHLYVDRSYATWLWQWLGEEISTLP